MFRTYSLLVGVLVFSLMWLVLPPAGVQNTSTSAVTIKNGKIVFVWDAPPLYHDHIYAMNPDGSNVVQLTSGSDQEFDPAWSPDGSKIVFSRSLAFGGGWKIYIMNADGSGQFAITDGPTDTDPAWSPDGSKIAFLRTSNRYELRTMNSDGTDQRVLATRSGFAETMNGPASWSPDGKKIAFSATAAGRPHIFVVNADGSNETALTNDISDISPAWSPDGTKIAFVRVQNNSLYTMNPDGSNQVQIGSFNGQQLFSPAWSPDGQQMALQISSQPSHSPNVYVINADGSNLTSLTQNTGANMVSGVSWQTLHVAPTQNPTLLTEDNSQRAIAMESVSFARDPFPLKAITAFGSDSRTRISVFVMNIDLQPGETFSAVTASAQDSQQNVFPLTVEYVGKVSNTAWLTQVNLVLPDQLSAGDVLITVTYHGVESNKALIKIKSS